MQLRLFDIPLTDRQVMRTIQWASSWPPGKQGQQAYSEYWKLENWASALYETARPSDMKRITVAINEARQRFAQRWFVFIPQHLGT